MDSSFIVRSPGRPASRGGVVRDAVPASLGAAQSVTAIAKSTEARADETPHVKNVLDAQSREAIYQVLNTGEPGMTRQLPEEVKQRLRVYLRRQSSRPRQQRPENDLALEG